MFVSGSKTRLVIGLIGIFAQVNIFYFFCSWSLPVVAVPFTLGLCTCVVVYFMFRWRVKPPVFDNEIQDLHCMLNLLPLLDGTFLPFGPWAMEPQSLVNLLNLIQFHKCNAVIECGSGLSTLLIGAVLELKEEGHLFSIEEDADWYRWMLKLVRQRGLENRVTLIHAPLEIFEGTDEPIEWYSTTEIEKTLENVKHVDLLLVDGPKSKSPLSRYPALPFFQPKIDEKTLIILDDAGRPQELVVIDRWKKEFSVELELQNVTQRNQARIQLRGS